MKNFYLIIFLFFALYCNGQTYTFDYILTYQSSSKDKSDKSSTFDVLLNSKNKDYYLIIFDKEGDARLLDDKTKRMHHFKSFKDAAGNYSFKHDLEIFGIAEYENKVTFKKSNKDLFSMKRILSKGVFRQSAYKVDFALKECEADLLFIFDEAAVIMTTKNIEQFNKLTNTDKNYIISKLISNYKGNSSVVKLIGFEKINTNVTIPNPEQ
ncbi:hypothetical protein [Frigoriflavimonas asaccharolytica]|uniref:Uncharacterized protein n=1 Tax=Frigoriflavimonas asaccharolytica TaxID=2735899 RepID=A0A8J8G9Z5_9FLAO|nr:hypothetical protein [Frigoriflavimonas asaccharolytica]NRS94123.1 hypothetical protein [Frigoriflavimonas asaccharolytica]